MKHPYLTMMGLYLAAFVGMFGETALIIGPTVAGFVIGALSWRWIFFLFAIIQLIAFVFASLFLISPYKLTKPRIAPASCIPKGESRSSS